MTFQNFRYHFGSRYDADVFKLQDSNSLFIFAYIKSEDMTLQSILKEAESKYKIINIQCIAGALKTKTKSETFKPIWVSEKKELITTELGCKILLESEKVLNPGLFLDQSENRKQMIQFMKKKPPGIMLNLFSYTGAFSIAARANGFETTSVDVSSRYLEWEKKNHALNGHSDGFRLIKSDARKFLEKACKKPEKYDLIVLDPPSFSRSDGETFKIEKELPKLTPLALNCLAIHGRALISTNLATWSLKDFRELMNEIARNHSCKIQPGELPYEFKSQKYPLKSLWFQKIT